MSSARCRRRWRRRASQVRTLVPGYPAVLNGVRTAPKLVHDYPSLLRRTGRLLSRRSRRARSARARRAASLRPAGQSLISAPDGQDWPDNALRFAALGRVAADIGQRAGAGLRARHRARPRLAGGAGSGLSAPTPAPRPATVITIHNLAFQGLFPADLLVDARPAAAASSRSTASNITGRSAS